MDYTYATTFQLIARCNYLADEIINCPDDLYYRMVGLYDEVVEELTKRGAF